MNNIWFVQVPGQSAAIEYTTESLEEAVLSGTVPSDALTYSNDSASWRPARDVLAAARLQPTAAPTPPVTNVVVPSAQSEQCSPPQPDPVNPATRPGVLRKAGIVGGCVLAALAALTGVLMTRGTTARDASVTKSVVQVDAGTASGTGFLVEGPDEWAYVATAFHVIDCGCPISIARAIEVSDDRYYLEAYPDTELVVYDADADLAILRLKNVRADRFHALTLASKPEKGEPIKAYGFPGRTLIRRQGLLKQQGEILSLGRFPVLDSITGEVLRDNAVDGLLISASIEAGYSGGPTCNERGEVVGVTTLKDRTKAQHNGAVSVDALAKLMTQMKPVQKELPPGEAEIKALVTRVERQYLQQSVEKRIATRPHEFIALEDRPGVLHLANLVRSMRSPSEQADLGLFMASQPGHPLETFRHSKIQQAIAECERRASDMRGFLQIFTPTTQLGDSKVVLDTAMAECEAIAERPITWDLTAITLQWENKAREISVAKVEAVDDELPVYRASITPERSAASFDIWVRREGADLKLKLFDDKGRPYGLSATRTLDPGALNGTWGHSSPRSPYGPDLHLSRAKEEKLQVTAQSDGTVQVRHTVNSTLYAPIEAQFPNCLLMQASGTFEQSFTGKIDGGAARLSRNSSSLVAPEFESCNLHFPYTPDKEIVLKVRDGKLVMYRTEGDRYPEEMEFERR